MIDKLPYDYDAVLTIPPTAPFIRARTVVDMILMYNWGAAEAIVTVSEIKHGHPYLSKKRVYGYLKDFVDVPEGTVLYPRQVRESVYYCNGCAFLRSRKLIEQFDLSTNCLGDDVYGIITGEEESINIDNEFDLKIARLLMKESAHR